MTGVTTVPIALGERSYDIVIGQNVIASAGEAIAPVLSRRRVHVVTDDNVAPLYLDSLLAGLDAQGITHSETVLPAGEQTKDFRHLEELLDRLQEHGVARDDTLIALGGGVVGDLVGFAASIILRGIDFIQVPTTLLAQVDSSVGGKTGINTRFGKNLVGSFHQPRLVLADTAALDTLPDRDLKAGYAETVKYGLIGDESFFTWLEQRGEGLLAGDHDARRHAIAACCAAKARFVAEDEREQGSRALLNLGHTFGHALEAEIGYAGDLRHGEAVSIGMVMAFDLSVRLGLCPPEDAARMRRHLELCGLPTMPPRHHGRALDPEALLRHMAHDKKVKDGKVTFILVRGIGEAFVSRDVAPEMVLEILGAAVTA